VQLRNAALLKYFLLAVTTWPTAFRGISFAQDIQPWSGFGIETNAIAGKVVKHEPKFTLPIPAITTGADIDFLLQTYGAKPWEQRRNYPVIGVGFAYINYGMDAVYGRCFGMYPNITLPVIRGSRLEWTLRLGEGIGYVTRTFSRINPVDTINVAVGSHVNGFFMLLTDIRYHVNQHWDILAGVNATHISNTSYHKPNLGINMVGAHIGIRYSPVTARPARLAVAAPPPANRWLVQARIGMSLISSYTPDGPLYPVYITSAYVSRRWLGKNKCFAGADFSYHQNIYAYLKNNELAVGHEAGNSYKSALFAGNEFLLGRVGIALQAGVYLKQAYVKLNPVYERITGNYYIVQKERGHLKECFLSVSIKSHLTVAEFMEAGIGFGF
jgi:hypothetical protein